MIIIKKEEEAVEVILKQKPLLIFQGKGELGPRSLGNRSILFDPRNKDLQNIINTIKKREWWRPVAGTILIEHANDYFDMMNLKESPYMSYAIKAKEKAKLEVPGIIHVDGTCRIQTLKKQDNVYYYNLINTFYKKTKVPILCNTSLNLAGYPIIENLKQLKKITETTELKNVYLP
jgi:carbamoyltransferase|tara:strand:- start:723 stop:1250 length:528 start_codon:yes stop_codon:yes gene_type:complete